MKYKAPKTTCHCGKPRRTNGRDCHECHRLAQVRHRATLKQQAALHVNVYSLAVKAFKRQLLLGAIEQAKGNLCRAAVRLGVHRSTVTRAMLEAGLIWLGEVFYYETTQESSTVLCR